MDHKLCLAAGCKTLREKNKLFCDPCWKRVPAEIKQKMLDTYTMGQFSGHSKPSNEWIEVAKEAIRGFKR